jgi:hypothetical protein
MTQTAEVPGRQSWQGTGTNPLRMTSRVSLTELAAAGIRLRPSEAVALVFEICRQHSAGKLRGIPSAGVIRITRDGDVVAEGPVTTNQDAVGRAARLLNVLVGGFEAPPEYRASGALQIIIARALGTLDLPRYESLDEFCAALGRFATLDVRDAARDLFKDFIRTRMPREAIAAPLTISDVRRARRATGLTLQDIAEVAGVPAARLRDLEWGDMRQWRADAEGRAHVTRYARAAGLDDQIVLSIAWPMIEEAFARADAGCAPATALVPSGPQQLVPAASSAPVAMPSPSARRWAPAAAALILALLAMVALTWTSVPEAQAGRPEPAPVMTSGEAPLAAAAVTTAVVAASEPARALRGARPPAPRKVSGKRPAPRRTSFLQKELFRIEIR